MKDGLTEDRKRVLRCLGSPDVLFLSEKFSRDISSEMKVQEISLRVLATKLKINHMSLHRYINYKENIPNIISYAKLCYWMKKHIEDYIIYNYDEENSKDDLVGSDQS